MVTRRAMLAGPVLASPVLLSRAQAQATPDIVRFSSEIEPLVRRIEGVEREKAAAWLASELQAGTPYRQLLAAVFLAGVRNVNPRPPGFALHCVFLGHAAHQLSLEAPPDVRAIPLFYVLDDFKAAQARDAAQKTGDYTMRQLTRAAAGGARELTAAMEAWDSERAEAAAARLARHATSAEVFEPLWRYGARDYRNIGHKAIYVANASRTLQTIGWQHAEPVLRSVALALLDFGREQTVNAFALNDQCYAPNDVRARTTFEKLPGDWTEGATAPAATRSLLSAMRTASIEDLCSETSARLSNGTIRAGNVWDAAHLFACELRMRSTGANVIAGLHSVTSVNALHTAYFSAADARLRYLLLLQAVGWMGQFRKFAESRPEQLSIEARIDAMEPSPGGADSLAEVFAAIPAKPAVAASRILRLARQPDSRRAYRNGLLRNTITKADEVHYYKYLVSLLETESLVSAEWRDHILAATAYYAKGSGDAAPAWAQRTREALKI